jgi:hypothetical protein
MSGTSVFALNPEPVSVRGSKSHGESIRIH